MRFRLPEILRPNGRTYRPRMVDAKVFYLDDDPAGIYVFGTHDVAFAEAHALGKVDDLNERWFPVDELPEYRFTLGYPGKRTWISLIPADDDLDGTPIRKVYTLNEARGRAAVEFGLQLDPILTTDLIPTYTDRRLALAGAMPPALAGFPSF